MTTASDYETSGSQVRSIRSGLRGARNPLSWIGHPNQGNGQRPAHPSYRLYDPADRWRADRERFEAVLASGDVATAIKLIDDSGFALYVDDVPEAHRAEFVRQVRLRDPNSTADFTLGEGWRNG